MKPYSWKDWIKDLRSGKFKQGSSALATNATSEIKYCCLGVACEGAELFRSLKSDVNDNCFSYLTNDIKYKIMPPQSLIKSMGIPEDMIYTYRSANSGNLESNVKVVIPRRLRQKHAEGRRHKAVAKVTTLNDNCEFTFAEIADCIEHTMRIVPKYRKSLTKQC